MTPKKAANEMKRRLDELPEKKTLREKLFTFGMIKLHHAIIEEALEKMRDAKGTETKQKPVIKKALKQLLTTLDKIFAKQEELGDSDVRDRLTAAIHKGFVHQQARALPETFGMFTEDGEKRVRAAVTSFLAHSDVLAAPKSLKTPENRLQAFQDDEARSSENNNYSEYFGYMDKPAAF
jgi:hypothetical protein